MKDFEEFIAELEKVGWISKYYVYDTTPKLFEAWNNVYPMKPSWKNDQVRMDDYWHRFVFFLLGYRAAKLEESE